MDWLAFMSDAIGNREWFENILYVINNEKKEGFNVEKERKFINRIYIYISIDYIFCQ